MQQLILISHVLIAIAIIALVLVQHGKGADMGAGFGGGASNTMFGSQGSTPFLVKLTGGLALLFFLTSGVMSFLIGKDAKPDAALSTVVAPMKTVPAIPVATDNVAEDKPVVIAPEAANTGVKPAQQAKKPQMSQKQQSSTAKTQ